MGNGACGVYRRMWGLLRSVSGSECRSHRGAGTADRARGGEDITWKVEPSCASLRAAMSGARLARVPGSAWGRAAGACGQGDEAAGDSTLMVYCVPAACAARAGSVNRCFITRI